MRIIRRTSTLRQILARDIGDPKDAFTRFAYGPERRRPLRKG